MFPVDILVIKTNPLVELTVASIEQNMPTAWFDVIPLENKSIIRTAFENTKRTTLIVSSGISLNIKGGDIPSVKKLERVEMVASKKAVYYNHPKYSSQYDNIGKYQLINQVDLSIFIINPHVFNFRPVSDVGVLPRIGMGWMPRKMNHKDDILINRCISAKGLLEYAIVGQQASVHNYVNNILSGEATINESMAYCFDLLTPYIDNIPSKYKENVLKLAELSNKRISKMRKDFTNKVVAPYGPI